MFISGLIIGFLVGVVVMFVLDLIVAERGRRRRQKQGSIKMKDQSYYKICSCGQRFIDPNIGTPVDRCPTCYYEYQIKKNRAEVLYNAILYRLSLSNTPLYLTSEDSPRFKDLPQRWQDFFDAIAQDVFGD